MHRRWTAENGVGWEDDLACDMEKAESQVIRHADAVARTLAARDAKIADLWRSIDRVTERVNDRVPLGRRRFRIEDTARPLTKAIFYGGRRVLFEVEPLAHDTWRNEPAFCPGGLARVYVDPAARDFTMLFCAVSDEGPHWLVMPSRRPLTDEMIGALLRVLLS